MVEVRSSAVFDVWFDALRDRRSNAGPDPVRIRRLQEGNPGQHRVLKSGGVEMKIDFGPGYRVYFTQCGAEIVLLLAGGDKSTQQHDVQLALRLAKEL